MNKQLALLSTLFALFVGILIGERTKGGFFRPWFDDGKIYIHDKVQYVRGTYDPDHCEYGVLLDIVDETALVRYSECWNEGDGPKWKHDFLKLVPTGYVKRYRKE